MPPKRVGWQKLTGAQTYQEMAQADEDWSDWESLPEGSKELPGEARK